MKRREFITAIGAAAATWPLAARAQQPTMPVIGFLSTASSGDFPEQIKAFQQSLSDGGYVEGRNINIEYRWAEGQYQRLPTLASDLVGRGAAVIATAGGVPPAAAAKRATTTIPIVFVMGADPVKAGLVVSLGRPGGNITGITSLNVEVGVKRIELLHELLPSATSVALLVNPAGANAEILTRDMQAAAEAFKLRHHLLSATTERELEAAFAAAQAANVGGMVIGTDALFISYGERLAALSSRFAIPTIFQFREFVAAGGLMSYGSDFTETYRLLGAYVARVLKGEKPGDLPVQQAAKVELLINLGTAKTLNLDVPRTLVARADEVME
jgi:putative ABC transport system substrate-binding protein